MTKEQILDEHLKGKCCDRNQGGYIDDYGVYDNIEAAMDEFAAQEVKEFIEFTEKQKWSQGDSGLWYNYGVDIAEQLEVTTPLLYAAFIIHRKLQQSREN